MVPIYNLLIDQLENQLDQAQKTHQLGIETALKAALEKLKQYYAKSDSAAYMIGTGTENRLV